MNQGAQQNLGYTLDELQTMTPADIKPNYTNETFSRLVDPLRAKPNQNMTFQTTHRRQDGSIYPVEIHLQYMPEAPAVFVALVIDITKREQTAKALKDSHEIINSSQAVAFLWQNSAGWPVEYVSENIIELLGYSADDFTSGRISYADLIHPQDVKKVGEEVANFSAMRDTTDFSHTPYRIITKQGTEKWLDDRTSICRNIDGEITHYRGVVLDITDRIMAEAERKQLENSLYQSDKMASVGQLAAGVAHEINNPIGFILSNLNTMREYLQDLNDHLATNDSTMTATEITEMIADFGDAIAESAEGANRVKDIVADMKGFSRVDSNEKELADINEGLRSTLNIVWNQLKYKCTVEKDFGDIPNIQCYVNRINQVFLNLLVNAGHAIDGDSGLITIKTWADEDFVHIAISDNGCGIAAENIPMLFNAFYTTKEIGEGTGLGLSLSHDIINKHGGRIEVQSELGVGSVFEVLLPLCKVLEPA